MVENDLRMFSCRMVERELIAELAGIFFEEMVDARIYSNTSVSPSRSESSCLGAWRPVTKHSRDTLICAISESCVAFWLYCDDE